MFIEYWQIGFVLTVCASAYFSFRAGKRNGMMLATSVVIHDLYNNGIIAIRRCEGSGEVLVGRYDEDDFDDEGDFDDEY